MLRNRVRELRAKEDYSDLGKLIEGDKTNNSIEKNDLSAIRNVALKVAEVFTFPVENIFWLEGGNG